MTIQLPFCPELDEGLDWKEKLIPKFIFFSGKGGVGKTTITSAMACARAKQGKKVLIISIDPAHSLGDSLKMDLTDGKMHDVPGYEHFQAMEMNIPISGGKKENQSNINDIAIQSLISDVMFPMSEEMNIIKGLVNTFKLIFKKGLKIDEIFIDSAPSGHMLRAITYPFQASNFLMGIFEKYRKLRSFFEVNLKRRKLLKQQNQAINSFKNMIKTLQNEAISTLVLVTIPEEMALSETRRTYEELLKLGISVSNIVINKIHKKRTRIKSECSFCKDRIHHESEIIKKIPKNFHNVSITKVPLFKDEINGLRKLETLESHLLG